MITRIAFGLFLILTVLSSAFGQTAIKKGETAIVPNWTWVEVKNLEPVENGNISYSYGRSCGIEQGGTVTVIGIETNRLLVRYSGGGVKYGTPCPSGIIFFTTKEEFSKMTAEYRRIKDAEWNEKSLVRRLLKK